MNDIDIKAEELPWLAGPQALLRQTLAAGRMPHGLLIRAGVGLGAEALALWTARLVMCESPAHAPCGRCRSCHWIAAQTHPDLLWVRREEEAKQLPVDAIRTLCGVLALKSHAGGYKVAVIAQADLMNTNAANALLKTLEEPPPATLLILCSARPVRLPATIVSRCQQVRVLPPANADALEWLKRRVDLPDWQEVLEHAAAAPLRALALTQGGFAELNREMSAAMTSLQARQLDLPATAERWAKTDFGARLDWLDTWITRRLRTALATPADLPSAGAPSKIRGLYALLDQVRGLKFEQNTSLNMQLAAEELLLRAEAALRC